MSANNNQKASAAVVVPPPEVKGIVDKLALRVAKNGSEFAQLILEHEQNNPKFNFLRFEDDPYRPYYLKQLAAAEEGADAAEADAPEEEAAPVEAAKVM